MSLKRFGDVCLVAINLILLAAIDQMVLGGLIENKIVEVFTIGLSGILLLIASLLHQFLLIMVPFFNRVIWPIASGFLMVAVLYVLFAPLVRSAFKKSGGGSGHH